MAYFKYIVNTDHRNLKDTSYILNIAFDIGLKTVGMSSYLFSRQHAGEGSHHSSRDCTDNVIQGGSVLFDRVHLVKLLYTAMDTIVNRL